MVPPPLDLPLGSNSKKNASVWDFSFKANASRLSEVVAHTSVDIDTFTPLALAVLPGLLQKLNRQLLKSLNTPKNPYQ